MNPPEIKLIISGDSLIPLETKLDRNELAENAEAITTISNGEQNQLVGECVVLMRKHVKSLTTERMDKTRPFDDAKKLIKDYYDDHCEILISEIERLEKLGTNFIESENRRVVAEEKKRQDEFAEAQRKQFALDDAARKASESGNAIDQMIATRKLEQAKSLVQEIINAPEPEANRAKGQQMKQVLCWEVTDLMELVKHNPQLCKIEPKASAINSTCHPNIKTPGLRCWFESRSTYTSR